MRDMVESLMKEGPQHPIYQQQAQERINMLENQCQQKDFLLKQMQSDNQELAQMVKAKEEESIKRKEKVEKKQEIKGELQKAKKSMKDKDKEVAKLRLEL